MEYISFLAGEEWTDHPACVHPHIATAARGINDALDDDERQRLLPLLPRLMGTSKDVGFAVLDAAAKYVERLTSHPEFFIAECAEAAQKQARQGKACAVTEASVAVEVVDGDLVAFLESLIDAYDRATGRDETPVVTEDDFRRLAELTGATR